MKPRDPEIAKKARELYEAGVTVDEIAKSLGVTSRAIYKWRKNQGWGARQTKDDSLQGSPASRQDLLRTWKQVADLALKRLESSEFKSAEGAVAALETASSFILKLSSEQEEEKPTEKVRHLFSL